MARDKLDIVNQALILLGDDPIESLETDTGAGAETARLIYNRVIKALFTIDGYKFRFAVKQYKLNQIQQPPMDAEEGGYKYAYSLPSDYLTLVSINSRCDYQIYGNELRTDDTNLILDYIAQVDEQQWPAYFEEMAVYQLAVELCKPVTDDSTLKSELAMQFEMKKRNAKVTDSKAVPNKQVGSSPLIAARMGGRSRFGTRSRW